MRIGAYAEYFHVFRPNARLTDRRQYTQAAGTRSKVSRCFRGILEVVRGRWLAGRTMIYFAPLLGAFVCARRGWRLLRLRLVPIACPILLHDIEFYASRASIGLRRRAVVLRTG
jgi:hypothetical protein